MESDGPSQHRETEQLLTLKNKATHRDTGVSGNDKKHRALCVCDVLCSSAPSYYYSFLKSQLKCILPLCSRALVFSRDSLAMCHVPESNLPHKACLEGPLGMTSEPENSGGGRKSRGLWRSLLSCSHEMEPLVLSC